jgi:Tfp pilus assembly protein PilF
MKCLTLAVILAAAALSAVAADVNENAGVCWMSLGKRADAAAVLDKAPDRQRAIAHAGAWLELRTDAVMKENAAKYATLKAYADNACKAVGVKPAAGK